MVDACTDSVRTCVVLTLVASLQRNLLRNIDRVNT